MACRMRFWIILGALNTRKGSLIRSLSGIPRESDCSIQLVNGQTLQMWAKIKSVNEGGDNLSNPEELVDSWIEYYENVNRVPWCNLLVASRLNLGRPGYEAQDYIQKFIDVGSWIESIITLGEPTQSWIPTYGVPYADIPFQMHPQEHTPIVPPTNEIGAKVRAFWGWR